MAPSNGTESSSVFTRRSVLTASAWSVPAVALVVATPASAASGTGVPPKAAIRLVLTASTRDRQPIAVVARINYSGTDAALPAMGRFTWSLTMQRQGDPTVVNAGSGVALATRGSFWSETVLYGSAPMPIGTYTATLLVNTSDGVATAVRTVQVLVPSSPVPPTMAEISLNLEATFRRRTAGDDFPLVLTTTYTGAVAEQSFLVPWRVTVRRPGATTEIIVLRSTSAPVLGTPGTLSFNYPGQGAPLPTLPPGDYIFTAYGEAADGEVVVTRTVTVP